ncbi:hypothetical protein ACWNYO_00635 [Candidatus Vidania fulgoroideorum]
MKIKNIFFFKKKYKENRKFIKKVLLKYKDRRILYYNDLKKVSMDKEIFNKNKVLIFDCNINKKDVNIEENNIYVFNKPNYLSNIKSAIKEIIYNKKKKKHSVSYYKRSFKSFFIKELYKKKKI